MNRAVGVYVFIAENKAGAATVEVVNEGELQEGLVAGTGVDRDEEGTVSVALPGSDLILTLMSLDVKGSKEHQATYDMCFQTARKAAKQTGKRFELVYFGPNGREHVRWIG